MKKTAIITGASTGMGREFAREINKKYKNIEEIWLIARSRERLLELGQELRGKKVKVLSLDLTKEADIKMYREKLEEENPDVCMLVNSAGYGKAGGFGEISCEDNCGMVRLNCQALTEVTYLTLPYMRYGGRVINLASAAAFVPQPEFAVYAATKSYVLSFSRALAAELTFQNISVTAVCPGPVKTEFFDTALNGGLEEIRPIKKLVMARPEKVVKKALKDAKKGKVKSVYGLPMKLFEIFCRLVPHKFILKCTIK